jgi:hypothetical protein
MPKAWRPANSEAESSASESEEEVNEEDPTNSSGSEVAGMADVPTNARELTGNARGPDRRIQDPDFAHGFGHVVEPSKPGGRIGHPEFRGTESRVSPSESGDRTHDHLMLMRVIDDVEDHIPLVHDLTESELFDTEFGTIRSVTGGDTDHSVDDSHMRQSRILADCVVTVAQPNEGCDRFVTNSVARVSAEMEAAPPAFALASFPGAWLNGCRPPVGEADA